MLLELDLLIFHDKWISVLFSINKIADISMKLSVPARISVHSDKSISSLEITALSSPDIVNLHF